MSKKHTIHLTSAYISVAALSLCLGACAMGGEFGDDYSSEGSGGLSDTDTDSGETDSGEPDSGDSEPGVDQGAVANETRELLTAKCSQCHSGDQAKGGIDYITDLSALVTQGKVERYDPEASRLFARITSESSPMPPAAVNQPLSSDEIELVRSWILVGAPPAQAAADCLGNDFISLDEMVEEMAKDIFAQDPSDRKFTRYLTLTHLHNSGLCDDEIEVYRQATAKILNSLSRDPLITKPVEIDSDGLILRIDLRDYGWDADSANTLVQAGFQDAWEATVIANPFAIEFTGDPADDLKKLAETAVPFQSADTLLQVISRGDLYYDLLGIPNNIDTLEFDLGVPDPDDPNLQDGEIIRAAFKESGVSNSNRIIERREIASGSRAYWRSYDFLDESGNGDIFAHPIDFEEAGGEIIFNLENDMQAYMLINQAGTRLNEAPTAVVKDPGQKDFVVRNGISCMRCHSAGIIPKADEFLPFFNLNKNDFIGEDFDLIERLYRPTHEMDAVQENDAANFSSAMSKAGLDTATDEPIFAVSSAFESNIDLLRAAAEFGITAERLDQELAILNLNLQNLRDGTVQREAFQEVYLDSICALLPVGEIQPVCPVGQ